MPEITPITSEALQSTIRRLLPSQVGFGDDLQATNLIQPVIDLTPTAEGSQLDTDLARAVALGSQTQFIANNAVETLATLPGFWRVQGNMTAVPNHYCQLFVFNTAGTSRVINYLRSDSSSGSSIVSAQVDVIVFLDTDEGIRAESSNAQNYFAGSYRQVADRYGNIVNPNGFTFE
jgi:hypothetical protein